MSTRMKIAVGIVVVAGLIMFGWPALINYLIPVSPYW